MKYHIKLIVTVIFTVTLLSSVIVASEDNRSSIANKETMKNQCQAITSRLDAFPEFQIVDALSKIVSHIERLPITQKTDSIVWKEQRRAKLELWLKALGKLDRMMDPKFDPNDVPLKNIAPSSSSIAYDSGIAPSAIKDPKVRAEYEQAIKLNAEKGVRCSFQMKLRRLDKNWSSKVSAYIKSQYTSDDQDIKEINTLIDKQFSGSPRKEQLKEAFLGGREPIENASQQTTNETTAGATQISKSGKTNDLLELLEIRANPDRPHPKPD